jgi:hypothetical protein
MYFFPLIILQTIQFKKSFAHTNERVHEKGGKKKEGIENYIKQHFFMWVSGKKFLFSLHL